MIVSLIQSSCDEKGAAEIVVGPSIVGVELERSLIIVNCLIEPSLGLHRQTQIAICPCVIRIVLESFFVVLCCFSQRVLKPEGIADRTIAHRCIWPACQRCPVVARCFFWLSISEQRVAEFQVGPEVGRMFFLHPFKKRWRIAASSLKTFP